MTRFGVLAGLESEARLLEGAARELGAALIVATGPADLARLEEAPVDLLISFGLAGALAPHLNPGDLLLPEQVTTRAGKTFHCTERERAHASTAIPAHGGGLLGLDEPIATAEAKARAYQETGALATDMESHRLAMLAEARGLPFIVLRAVVDPADMSLPHAALAAMDPAGGVRLGRFFLALLRRPWELPAIVTLAGHSRAAHGSLGRAAGPLLAL